MFKFRVDKLDHGYDIQNDEIWKSILDKMKNCVHVWKSRNLTYIQYRSLILLLLIHPCMLIIPMPPFSTPKQQTFD
jgi:hypothetical protein